MGIIGVRQLGVGVVRSHVSVNSREHNRVVVDRKKQQDGLLLRVSGAKSTDPGIEPALRKTKSDHT